MHTRTCSLTKYFLTNSNSVYLDFILRVFERTVPPITLRIPVGILIAESVVLSPQDTAAWLLALLAFPLALTSDLPHNEGNPGTDEDDAGGDRCQ